MALCGRPCGDLPKKWLFDGRWLIFFALVEVRRLLNQGLPRPAAQILLSFCSFRPTPALTLPPQLHRYQFLQPILLNMAKKDDGFVSVNVSDFQRTRDSV